MRRIKYIKSKIMLSFSEAWRLDGSLMQIDTNYS